ncbi:MAG TPA: GNAT family protein [Burkholderiales bacterium]|nr:GNAT family protein [Burkholderiales bacterium]
MIHPKPATLEGHAVRLEPLSLDHEKPLMDAAKDGRLWELFFTSVPETHNTKKYIEEALKGQERGDMLPWAVRDLKSGAIIGSTRYHDIIAAADRVEIGWTWYAQRVQRSHVNTACKLLLFGYAFESLKCKVVGLRTDNFNFRSQRAIEALGVKKDGVIRHHWPRRDGTIRDSVMYSVLVHEWADVKRYLEFRLKRNETH